MILSIPPSQHTLSPHPLTPSHPFLINVVYVGNVQCETCSIYKQYATELEHIPPTLGGRRHTLEEIETYMINAEKPPLKLPQIPKKVRPGWWTEQFRQFVRDMRSTLRLKSIPKPEPPVEFHVDDADKKKLADEVIIL